MRSLRLKFSFLRSRSPSSYSRIVLPAEALPPAPPTLPREPQTEAPPTLLEPSESDLAPAEWAPPDAGVRG